MSSEQPFHQEQFPEPVLQKPSVDSLLHSEDSTSPWPESIRNNPELKKQTEIRNTAHQALSRVYEKNELENEDLIGAMDSLSDLYESDPLTKRMLLYIPFELIPESDTENQDESYKTSAERFRSVIKETWYELLNTQDVRANFVDGDVLEVELRSQPLERVIKAAHLIPVFVEKGILSIQEVISLIDDNPDTLLAKSIAETIPVLEDMQLISHEEAFNILDRHPIKLGSQKDIITQDKITPTRQAWMDREQEKKNIEARALEISETILSGTISPEDLAQEPASIIAVRYALESLASRDPAQAMELYNTYESFLINSLEISDPSLDDALQMTFAHLVNLGIADSEKISNLGIYIPALDGDFSTMQTNLESETQALEHLIKNIEQNEELLQYIYPTTILFGSRLKGYGAPTADLDFAVFVRPGVDPSSRGRIQELLQQTTENTITGKAVEFWLEEDGDELSIKNFDSPDVTLADNSWAHTLFEGAWYGDTHAISELHSKLLPGFLYSKDKKINNQDARSIWLEEMERDTLQYRLLHRGYARYYPQQTTMNTPHSDLIDGKSTFFDAGYRRLATQLYINKVFLPQLEK